MRLSEIFELWRKEGLPWSTLPEVPADWLSREMAELHKAEMVRRAQEPSRAGRESTWAEAALELQAKGRGLPSGRLRDKYMLASGYCLAMAEAAAAAGVEIEVEPRHEAVELAQWVRHNPTYLAKLLAQAAARKL